VITDLAELKDDLGRRMDGALETLRRDFAGLRTGRASPGLLEPVRVEAYGTEMPLTQVGTIGVPEARMLTVQVWDRALVSAVDRRAAHGAREGRRPLCRGRAGGGAWGAARRQRSDQSCGEKASDRRG
jgi:ribosome recycling factor